MKVIIVDFLKRRIEKEVEIPRITVVDKMYVKELGLIPLAYVFDAAKRTEVESALLRVREAEAAFETVKGEVFYKVLPQFRP